MIIDEELKGHHNIIHEFAKNNKGPASRGVLFAV
jgi:hypothetical protein